MAHINVIMPIRCFTCHKPVGHLWSGWQYLRLIKGNNPDVVREDLETYGLVRDCCRRMVLTHTEPTSKKEVGRLVRPAKHLRPAKT